MSIQHWKVINLLRKNGRSYCNRRNFEYNLKSIYSNDLQRNFKKLNSGTFNFNNALNSSHLILLSYSTFNGDNFFFLNRSKERKIFFPKNRIRKGRINEKGIIKNVFSQKNFIF